MRAGYFGRSAAANHAGVDNNDMRVGGIIWTIIVSVLSLILSAALMSFAYKRWLRFRFRLRHASKGRPILFVYSNSPHWKDYIESNILPRIESHAVTLNWSERKSWDEANPLEAKIFRRWAGDKEFNPAAIVFPPVGEVKVVRFWHAFRDYKHGKEQPLKRAQEELFKAVDELESRAV